MNEFEAYNLKRLSENLEAAKIIEEERRREIIESEARHMVYVLFEKHQGNLDAIKASLREQADIIEGLQLKDVVNEEYKRHLEKKSIYDPEAHRVFWTAIYEMAQIHNQQFAS